MDKINGLLIKKFLQKVGHKLAGDWVLVGGSLLSLLGETIRVTYDIDFAGFGPKEQAQTLGLLKLAESLRLPIESVNQAASFFLQKIPDWKANLILIHKGAHASIYRPNSTLFICLKLNRFSESDLEDCVAMIRLSRRLKEPIDHARLSKAIHARRAKNDKALTKRLDRLSSALRSR